MSEFRQGTGTFKLGSTPTEYGSAVLRATIVKTTATETLPATLADDEEDEVGGAIKRMLEIEFLEERAADGCWAELDTAFESATQELAFELTTDGATVSLDNPKFSGTVRVTNLRVAPAQVGKIRTQVITVPIKKGTYTVATS